MLLTTKNGKMKGQQVVTNGLKMILSQFATTRDAVVAALRFQHAMNAEPWSPEVIHARVGMHIGEAEGNHELWFYEDGSFTGEGLIWNNAGDTFIFTDRVEGACDRAEQPVSAFRGHVIITTQQILANLKLIV